MRDPTAGIRVKWSYPLFGRLAKTPSNNDWTSHEYSRVSRKNTRKRPAVDSDPGDLERPELQGAKALSEGSAVQASAVREYKRHYKHSQ